MESQSFSLTPSFYFNDMQAGGDMMQEQVDFQGKQRHWYELNLSGQANYLLTDNGMTPYQFIPQKRQGHLEQFPMRIQPNPEDDMMYELSANLDQSLTVPVPDLLDESSRQVKNFGMIMSNDQVSELHKQVEMEAQEQASSLTSLDLLRNYGSLANRLKGQKTNNSSNDDEGGQKFSVEEIVKIAASRYIQFCAQGYGEVFLPAHPFESAFTGLSDKDIRDVELAHYLLAAAEKLSHQEFDHARQLLQRCQWVASPRGNSVQRVVHYFVEALQERIAREMGGLSFVGYQRNEEQELIQSLSGPLLAKCHKLVPFNQIMQFAAIQSIVESVASKTQIHIIDLEIGCGVRWMVLMQALAEREKTPLEILKITAVGLIGRDKIEEVKERLTSVAESLKIPFSLKAIMVRELSEINEEMFEVEEGEGVAVYCPYILRTMIAKPSTLDNPMRVIRNLKPSVMTVLEVEANHNSPAFVSRFTEALFHYSTYFDALDTCFQENEECQAAIDLIMSAGIRNIVAREGNERTVRNVKIDVWRAFFARFRMEEVGFSESSYYQANLVMKRIHCGNHCNIERNGDALVIGWKGAPMYSVSAWKFR